MKSLLPARDKFKLYQKSVQDPKSECRFALRVYRELRNKLPRALREDFAGTALLSCEWVRRVPGGRAVAVDLDRATLEYARKHSLAQLGPARSRVTLLQANVLEAKGFRPDVVTAYNFSYFVFKTRDLLKKYFTRVYRSLAKDGIFILDIFGGPEAQAIMEERYTYNDFTYVWDQAAYNPITAEARYRIHFEFPDGSRLRNAFVYEWRIWNLSEIKDLLGEVGFDQIHVYWEGTDTSGIGGNGVFRRSLRGDDALSWIAYVVASK
jgi:SAM-dependent methyltransferase